MGYSGLELLGMYGINPLGIAKTLLHQTRDNYIGSYPNGNLVFIDQKRRIRTMELSEFLYEFDELELKFSGNDLEKDNIMGEIEPDKRKY